LAVFALSAAMAGVGGVVYGGALRAIDGQGVDFFAGLAIIMVMVIAGIDSIGAALFVGLFIGTPVLQNVFPSLKQLQTVLVGFAGIGLGQNPNGFIANNIRAQWDVLLEEGEIIVGVIAVLAALYGARLAHVIDSWTLVIVGLVVLAVTPQVAAVLHRRRTPGVVAVDEAAPTPLEWLGIDAPFRPQDVAIMDRVLDLPPLIEERVPLAGAGADGAP
jgi:branched-chain amino acid transport system permease protein